MSGSISKPPLVAGEDAWHAEEVARRTLRYRFCVFWSELFGEKVAFVRDGWGLQWVPRGVVAYTLDELAELYGGEQGPGEAKLGLVHEVKRQGGQITQEVK